MLNPYDFGSPSVTFEGDNNVMAIQSMSFIKKTLKEIEMGKIMKHPVFTYLNHIDDAITLTCNSSTPEHFLSMEAVDEALRVTSSFYIKSTFNKMAKDPRATKEKENFIYANEMFRLAYTHL